MSALTAVKQKEAINDTVTKQVFGKKNRAARKIHIKNQNLSYMNRILPTIVRFLAVMANATLVAITLVIGFVMFCAMMVSGFFQIINRSFESSAILAGRFYRLRKVRE